MFYNILIKNQLWATNSLTKTCRIHSNWSKILLIHSLSLMENRKTSQMGKAYSSMALKQRTENCWKLQCFQKSTKMILIKASRIRHPSMIKARLGFTQALQGSCLLPAHLHNQTKQNRIQIRLLVGCSVARAWRKQTAELMGPFQVKDLKTR